MTKLRFTPAFAICLLFVIQLMGLQHRQQKYFLALKPEPASHGVGMPFV